MTVGIDIRVLAKGTRTGVEDYTINLLSRLLSADKSVKYRLFYSGFRKLDSKQFWLKLPNAKIKKLRIPNRIFDLFLKIFRWPKLDKAGKINVFLSPHFLITPLSKETKRIMIFYDLSFLRFPEFFSFSKRWWHKFVSPGNQAQKADLIVSISESTKKDLIELYKISPGKIKVIYPGIGEEFRVIDKKDPRLLRVKEKYKIPDNFILYFGTIEPRKNILALVKAFEEIKRNKNSRILEVDWQGFEGVVKNRKASRINVSNLKLVIAGAKGWLCGDFFKKIEESDFKKDIFFTGFIEEEDKPYLYSLADVFVYPSFFEGFGLPPLEAMACGVPAIVSNKSSLPEVVGRGAVMVDPQNQDELAFVIREVLNNQELKNYLIKKGLERAKQFNWDNTVKNFLNLFKIYDNHLR